MRLTPPRILIAALGVAAAYLGAIGPVANAEAGLLTIQSFSEEAPPPTPAPDAGDDSGGGSDDGGGSDEDSD